MTLKEVARITEERLVTFAAHATQAGLARAVRVAQRVVNIIVTGVLRLYNWLEGWAHILEGHDWRSRHK